MIERFTVGLIVNNRHGVLNRIAGLYGKRGYNIDSLSVGETEDPRYSRMTIVSSGDIYIQTQVIRQLNKLYDVKSAVILDKSGSISVEHLLIKLKINGNGNNGITALINEYGGKVLHLCDQFIIADITGSPERIQAFIDQSKSLGIYELCRSGALALSTDIKNTLQITYETKQGENEDGTDVL
ncbi:MAG: acetolactate synthase small subunit [Oscillospiraceae bacterium]|nr:acetolactate synthase small subunit [Oscillospiraceae bacterium]